MSKRAIIVVDLQKEYLASGKLALVGIDDAVANAAKVIDRGRAKGDAIIHILHEFVDPSAPFFNPGTEGVEAIPAVQPRDGETAIVKNYPNSFRETNLKAVLDAKGIDEVVVVGAMSHMCIDATSRAAADYGYKTTIVHDACATRDLEFGGVTVPANQVHAAMMAALAFAYGTVTTTAELLA
jgi:nicotinamidase-related amidase